jgi:hypothetical protein
MGPTCKWGERREEGGGGLLLCCSAEPAVRSKKRKGRERKGRMERGPRLTAARAEWEEGREGSRAWCQPMERVERRGAAPAGPKR